jgi:hypothetical protein
MNGLAGARVLLLDDEEQEALPIIKGLSKIAVPVAYFDGKTAGFPSRGNRLRGVRLAILDIHLGHDGTPRNIASTLVQTFSKIMSPFNGPYGILIWTKHPDLREEVARYIFLHPELPNPVFIVSLIKSGFLRRHAPGDDGGAQQVSLRFSLARFSKHLVAELAENSPIECMQRWEETAFEAATNVTNSLSDLTGIDTPDLTQWRKVWKEESLKLLLAIARAKAEGHHSGENCISSVLSALNPLQSDRMDALVEKASEKVASHAKKIMAAAGGTSVDRKAKINTMLHLATDQLGTFSPGNLYIFGRRNSHRFLPKLTEVLSNCIHAEKGHESSKLKEVAKLSRLIGLEISPVCDHAQKKLGFSRMITGFALPHDHHKLINSKSQFVKCIGPFYLSKKKSAVPTDVYFNSRYVTSVRLRTIRGLMPPVGRLRSELLADVQSWAAYQGARQGVMLLK